MSKIRCLSYCFFWNIPLARGLTYTSVIQTESGPIRGFISRTIENVEYAAFKGIPYAKPPVGYLRFKPSVMVDGWTDVYNASSEGSMCTQFDSTTNSLVGSEDCLYINVYTPHAEFNGSISKPVMVWIYGGAFLSGDSNQSSYGPDFLLKAGVIVVAFNYRVSALGFLNLEHENATGNCGLKDNMGFSPFRPSLEKPHIVVGQEKFLTTCSVLKYITGNYTKGPHIMDFTANETLFLEVSLSVLLNRTETILESLENATSKIPFLSDLANAILTGISNLAENSMYQFIKHTTDLLFILGIDTKQKLISRNNKYPIYYYRFSFKSNYSFHKASGINLEGTGHVDDVPYIFYAPIAQLPLNQSDIAITRQRMVKLYTNFAKYGNPTPDGDDDEILGITWPDSRSSGEHLEIGSNLTTGPRPTDTDVKGLQLAGLGASPV